MANPQKENGYTAIANEIMDALIKIRVPGEAMQILLVILRKTYGWNKRQDAISLSQFFKDTGMKKPSIIRLSKIVSNKANLPLAIKLTLEDKYMNLIRIMTSGNH